MGSSALTIVSSYVVDPQQADRFAGAHALGA
jgi:hypothetical protein